MGEDGGFQRRDIFGIAAKDEMGATWVQPNDACLIDTLDSYRAFFSSIPEGKNCVDFFV